MTDIDNNSGMKDVDQIPEAQVVGMPQATDEDVEYVGKIKVINTLTGEVSELEYRSATQIRQLYAELEGSRKAIVRAQEKLKALLERFMTQHDQYEFPDGAVVRWVNRSSSKINFGAVSETLGEDTAALLSDVSITKLKNYLKEAIKNKELTYEDQDKILSNVYTVEGKPFLKIGE